MKKLLVILFCMLAVVPAVFANGISMLRIKLTDNTPIVISIDGKRFNKSGRSLTISDLPSGKHRIQVYEYKSYSDGSGGHAKLLYSGSVKTKKGMVTSAVVDVRNDRMTTNMYPMQGDSYTEPIVPKTDPNAFSMQAMSELKTGVDNANTDTDKLKQLETALQGRTYSTEQVRQMMTWLSFESSRLDFAKWAYPTVTDKQNFGKVGNELSMQSSKDELNDFIKSQTN